MIKHLLEYGLVDKGMQKLTSPKYLVLKDNFADQVIANILNKGQSLNLINLETDLNPIFSKRSASLVSKSSDLFKLIFTNDKNALKLF